MAIYGPPQTPWENLTDDQLLAVIGLQSTLMGLPGVLQVQPEYATEGSQQLVVAVYLETNHQESVEQLPPRVAGLRVVAKLEDEDSGHVVEIVGRESFSR